jgi:dTDP-4-amino-4,6-dideoxygalactose transaminase
MGIPLVDLGWQHREVEDEVRQGFDEVLANTSFILGRHVTEFEDAFAKFSGVEHCVGVANGTDALELALRAVGVGHGDEVVVPANTFIASALAVQRAGAVPVFVDSDPVYHLIDVDQTKGAIGERTKALMPVHLYGQMAELERLQPLAEDAGIALIEDAAQSQGASRKGRPAGSFGEASGTSFYPGKNIGAYGDAGAVLTNDDAIRGRLRALRAYGSEQKYHHPEAGFNSRLDTLQAVVLLAKLARLSDWNQMRVDGAARYDALLADVPDVVLPRTLAGNAHVWHLYVIRVPERDRVLEALNSGGVGAGIHYPVPCHLQGAFAHLGHGPGDFPVAEQAANEILSLPLFPGITEEQQVAVVAELRKALA